jgi:hypothetical protein
MHGSSNTPEEARENNSSALHWIRALQLRDWGSVGLLPMEQWAPSWLTAVRLVGFASSPMGLLIGKTGIIVANPSAERLLTRGVGPQLTGASIFDRLPDHHALIHTILNRALAGEAVSFPDPTLEGATELRESLGFEFELIPIANARGGFDGVMVTIANVGADQQRIRELTESEARLRLALHASGMVGTWTLDIATGHATADANVARVYGLPETECFSGIDAALFEEAVHPEDRAPRAGGSHPRHPNRH